MKIFAIIFLIGYVKLSTAEHVMACEDGQINLACPEGKVVEIVSANYGRRARDFCDFGALANLNCSAAGSLDIVKGVCGRQRTCNIHSSYKVFGDPCVGTNKYLEIEYKCINDVVLCDGVEQRLKQFDTRLNNIETYIYGKSVTQSSHTKPWN